MNRLRDRRFRRDYTNEDIISYLKGVHKLIKKAPTFRDVVKIPGPSPRTIVRRFGKWSEAIKKAGMRPYTMQLKRGEKSYIRFNWRKMTDRDIANKLGVGLSVVRHYRMNFNLWKNRKGTAKSIFRKKALNLYGEACECCGVKMCEWHHIMPRSKDPKDWVILCPTCHAVITRKLVTVGSRQDIKIRLRPFVQKLYSDVNV